MDVPLLPALDTAAVCEFRGAPLSLGRSPAEPASALDRQQPPPRRRVDQHRSDDGHDQALDHHRRGRDAWLDVVERMDEVELRRLVGSLPVIEQAKGVLMGYYGVDANRAFAILRRWSSVHHVKVRDLAALLVEHVDTSPPDRASATGAAASWSPFGTVQTFVEQAGLG